jgi:hypothetical protein
MELTNLKKYISAIIEVWDEPRYITLKVLVQNMEFYAKTNPEVMKAVEAMSILHKGDHVVEHVFQTLCCIQMGEDFENFEEKAVSIEDRVREELNKMKN